MTTDNKLGLKLFNDDDDQPKAKIVVAEGAKKPLFDDDGSDDEIVAKHPADKAVDKLFNMDDVDPQTFAKPLQAQKPVQLHSVLAAYGDSEDELETDLAILKAQAAVSKSEKAQTINL